MKYTVNQISQLIDHTNLRPDASDKDIEKLCQEAKDYHFKMVAINQVQSKIAAQYLKDTDIHVGAAIAFPLGQTSIKAKRFETENAIENGATEIDYVINISEVKNGNFDYIAEEMQTIVAVCQRHGVISKVIFETCYLSRDEIQQVAEIAREILPDFIKTSTGFGSGGATLEDVKLMKETVGDLVKVKAAGGIRDLETLVAMVQHGAERIGTSSGICIINELKDYLDKNHLDAIDI